MTQKNTYNAVITRHRSKTAGIIYIVDMTEGRETRSITTRPGVIFLFSTKKALIK